MTELLKSSPTFSLIAPSNALRSLRGTVFTLDIDPFWDAMTPAGFLPLPTSEAGASLSNSLALEFSANRTLPLEGFLQSGYSPFVLVKMSGVPKGERNLGELLRELLEDALVDCGEGAFLRFIIGDRGCLRMDTTLEVACFRVSLVGGPGFRSAFTPTGTLGNFWVLTKRFTAGLVFPRPALEAFVGE